MTLQILDGPLQSNHIPLRLDYIFNGEALKDSEILTEHAKVIFDHNLSWKINSLSDNKIRVGSDEVTSISLIPGLIFHLGQTGFKVIERSHPSPSEWELKSGEFIRSLDLKDETSPSTFFFLAPVQITFIQGPQAGEIYTLSYGPRVLGFNQLDINLKDPAQPHELLSFVQVGDTIIIKNLSESPQVLINQNTFTEHILTKKTKISFGTNIIEISILN